MKKLFLVGALALFGAVNAQTEKGSWVAGGSTTLGFNNVTSKQKSDGNSVDGPSISTFNITPSVGYFVIDKLAIGLDLGFTSLTTKEDEITSAGTANYKTTVSSFSLMPTATYYFKSGEKLIPYAGVGLGYDSSKRKYTATGASTYNEDYNDSGFAWKAKGGLVYLITPSIGLDLGVSFKQVSSNQEYPNYVLNGYTIVQNGTQKIKTTQNTFGVTAGFSFFFK